MSGAEKEQILLDIKNANKPVLRAVVTIGIGGLMSFITLIFYLGGIYAEYKEMREWKVTTAPRVEQHEKQIAVINDRLRIKQ